MSLSYCKAHKRTSRKGITTCNQAISEGYLMSPDKFRTFINYSIPNLYYDHELTTRTCSEKPSHSVLLPHYDRDTSQMTQTHPLPRLTNGTIPSQQARPLIRHISRHFPLHQCPDYQEIKSSPRHQRHLNTKNQHQSDLVRPDYQLRPSLSESPTKRSGHERGNTEVGWELG